MYVLTVLRRTGTELLKFATRAGAETMRDKLEAMEGSRIIKMEIDEAK